MVGVRVRCFFILRLFDIFYDDTSDRPRKLDFELEEFPSKRFSVHVIDIIFINVLNICKNPSGA